MKRILLFADRLPPLVGGMEVHAGSFIDYFKNHCNFPLQGVITKNCSGQDCIWTPESLSPVELTALPNLFIPNPDILFFNSGRWIEDLEQIKQLFPQSAIVYRTGGNEIIKAPLERAKIPFHSDRQKYWRDQINKHVDILISNSVYTESRLIEVGIEPSIFFRCVGGVNIFDNVSAEIRKGPKSPPVFFSAARFVPYKNHHLLLEVFGIIAKKGWNFKLRLAGDGPLLDSMKIKVQEIGLSPNTEFIGSISNDQVLREICNSDYFVQLSSEYETIVEGGKYLHAEGMGRAILEAISLGVFVISSNAGALPEIVSPDRGLLVDLSTAERIATDIERLLVNPPPKPLGTKEYLWPKYFLQYEKIWNTHEAISAGN